MKVSVGPSDDNNSISVSSYDIKAPIIILVANGPVAIRLEYFPVTKSSKTRRKVVPFVVRDVDFFFFCTPGIQTLLVTSTDPNLMCAHAQ